MTSKKLETTHYVFKQKIKKSLDFIGEVNSLGLRSPHLYSAYELAFLKTFTAWETFIEDVFIAYMTGHITRKCKPKTYLKKITKEHAYDLLKGVRDYPDWTRMDQVLKLADLYFIDGAPFHLPLSRINTIFNEMKKIRDAISHVSSNSRDTFLGIIRANLTSYDKNMTPGEFLSRNTQRTNNDSFLNYYIRYLMIASEQIVPL